MVLSLRFLFGSSTNENTFLIDGTDFTSPSNGAARAEPGLDFAQEVQLQSAGASAEYGNTQGAVVNVVTRQGSSRLLLEASYYWQTDGLTSQPVRLPIPGAAATESGYDAEATTTSPPVPGGRPFAIGSGSSPATTICGTPTASRARPRGSRGPPSRARCWEN